MGLRSYERKVRKLSKSTIRLGLTSATLSGFGKVGGSDVKTSIAPLQEGIGVAGSFLGPIGIGLGAKTALETINPQKKRKKR